MEATELQAYRRLAVARFQELLLKQPEQATDADLFLDQAIRALSKLPPRAEGAPPYVGLYGSKPELDEYHEYRDVAGDRLQELLLAQPKLHDLDGEVDKFIRLLSKLPPRPANTEPYARLFTLPKPDATVLASDALPADLAGGPQLVTVEQLLQIAGSNEFESRIRALTPGVNATLNKYKINTSLRIAHFLAQVMHESGGFGWVREIWGPTDWQVDYEPETPTSIDLGNTQPGDGRRYMGRGLIQLTGRYNYTQFSKDMGMGTKLVDKPELLEANPWAALTAGWYWDSRNINEVADKDDLTAVTRRINPGLLGIDDRGKYLKRAKLILK